MWNSVIPPPTLLYMYFSYQRLEFPSIWVLASVYSISYHLPSWYGEGERSRELDHSKQQIFWTPQTSEKELGKWDRRAVYSWRTSNFDIKVVRLATVVKQYL